MSCGFDCALEPVRPGKYAPISAEQVEGDRTRAEPSPGAESFGDAEGGPRRRPVPANLRTFRQSPALTGHLGSAHARGVQGAETTEFIQGSESRS